MMSLCISGRTLPQQLATWLGNRRNPCSSRISPGAAHALILHLPLDSLHKQLLVNASLAYILWKACKIRHALMP